MWAVPLGTAGTSAADRWGRGGGVRAAGAAVGVGGRERPLLAADDFGQREVLQEFRVV